MTNDQVEASRVRFEAWFLESRRNRGRGNLPTFERHEHDNSYRDEPTQRHWWTWQCASRDALENAER